MNQTHDMGFYRELLLQHQYAFVDRAAASENMVAKFPIIPLVPARLKNENDIKLTPALVPLEPDAPHMELLAACMTLGEKNPSVSPVATLIVVPPHINSARLKAHLISRLIVRSPQGQAFLRYYSADIFPHLVRILSPARLQSLFGPKEQVSQWTYRFQNDWITVPAPEVTEGVPLSWIISQGERESLDLVGEVNKTLDAHQKTMGRPWNDRAEWNEKASAVELSIGVARRLYRLSAPADLIAFGTHTLAYAKRIYTHPRIHGILQDAADHPGAYHDATRVITHDEWLSMAAELPAYN